MRKSLMKKRSNYPEISLGEIMIDYDQSRGEFGVYLGEHSSFHPSIEEALRNLLIEYEEEGEED